MNLSRTATGYSAVWPNGILALVRRLRETHDSLYGEVEFRVRNSPEVFLTEGQMNLSSITVRAQWEKKLEKAWPLGDTGDWEEMLERLCRAVARAYRKGSPVQIATGSPDVKPPEWALDPIIRRNMVNGIIGERDSCKSLIAVTCAALCQIEPAQTENAFHFVPPAKPMLWLYLDWETSFDDFDWRWRCILAGMGHETLPFTYRRCDKKLASEFEGISAAIEETGADGIIVDSVGMAAGGDLNNTESAFGFLEPLRSLKDRSGQPLTILMVGHLSKDPKGNKKTFTGNGYFTNEARNVWEIQATPGSSPGQKRLTFYHNKWNTTFYHKSRSVFMDWDEQQGVTSFSPADNPTEASDKKVHLYVRCKNILARGPLTIDALASELGEDPTRSRLNSLATLLRGYNKLFIQINDSWSLLALQDPDK